MSADLMQPIGPVGAAARCPGCGSGNTVWVTAAAQSNLLCKTCGACWHPSESRAERVVALHCPGCAWRGVCAAANLG